jgi:hypothetical protein
MIVFALCTLPAQTVIHTVVYVVSSEIWKQKRQNRSLWYIRQYWTMYTMNSEKKTSEMWYEKRDRTHNRHTGSTITTTLIYGIHIK